MLLLSEIPLFEPSLPSQPPCNLGMYSEWSYLHEICTQVLFMSIVYIDPESHDCLPYSRCMDGWDRTERQANKGLRKGMMTRMNIERGGDPLPSAATLPVPTVARKSKASSFPHRNHSIRPASFCLATSPRDVSLFTDPKQRPETLLTTT